jgi:hypothetical protein
LVAGKKSTRRLRDARENANSESGSGASSASTGELFDQGFVNLEDVAECSGVIHVPQLLKDLLAKKQRLVAEHELARLNLDVARIENDIYYYCI